MVQCGNATYHARGRATRAAEGNHYLETVEVEVRLVRRHPGIGRADKEDGRRRHVRNLPDQTGRAGGDVFVCGGITVCV